MDYIKTAVENRWYALTKQISVGRMVYGLCLGLVWGMGNVFNGWWVPKFFPPRDPLWRLKPEMLLAEDEKLNAIMPDDLPTDQVFSEDDRSDLYGIYPHGESSDAMSEVETEEEFMSKENYLKEVDICKRQIKDIVKKAREDGKLPPR